jgi:RpiR family transcriptional regulator, carbohydrate utilization regulator
MSTDVEWELTSGHVHSLVTANRPGLAPSDLRVIEVMMTRPHDVLGWTVSQVAAVAGSSTSTVVRACQSLGFRGYQDLKLALARDIAIRSEDALTHAAGLGPRSTAGELLERVLYASAQALRDAVTTVDPASMEIAIDRLNGASRVLVVGNGTSSGPAYDAAYRLNALGLWTRAPRDSMGQHLGAVHLSSTDAALVISHTGSTRETLVVARAAAERSAFVVAITSFSRSPLEDLADVTLVAGGPDQGFRLEAMSSRLAHLAVIDALFVGLALRRGGSAAAALDLMADVTVEHSL